MPYTTNPHLPRLRMQAVRLALEKGWSTRQAARYTGFNQSSIVRWIEKARMLPSNLQTIPTKTSRPHHHPHELREQIVTRILELRKERRQCAEILHWRLVKEGVVVSLSSVKRVLHRYGMSQYSQWKKWHQYPPRPPALNPGVLVELDSMREGLPAEHLYLYALVDVCSRWGYAKPVHRSTSRASSIFVTQARIQAPFAFQTIQTDHGSEFSKWFTKVVEHAGASHRHSRVRTPTDNGHVERFIRTLQDECIHKIPRSLKAWNKELPDFIHYYNYERPHMALGMKTPMEVMRSY